MLRRVSRLLGITFVIAGLSLGAAMWALRTARADAPQPLQQPLLELSLTTDKPSYRSGESVDLILELRNTTTRTLQLVHPDYFGVTTIEVRDSSGTRVEPETFKGKRKAVQRLLTLGPGEKKRHTLGAMMAWTCCHGYRFELTKPGRYQVTVRIKNPPEKTQPPLGWNRDWVGTIAAAPLFIEVTPE